VGRAIKDGVKFESSPDTPEVQERNVTTLEQWHEAQKTRRHSWFQREPDAGRKRNYALGALQSIADQLARTTEGSRDLVTRDATWRLAGFVNAGALTPARYAR
jgi:hypothetical protein